MILPTKHIKLAESLIGLGAVLTQLIGKTPLSVDELWFRFQKINNDRITLPAYHSFDNVVLALNCLYVMGVIEIDNKGNIYNAIS